MLKSVLFGKELLQGWIPTNNKNANNGMKMDGLYLAVLMDFGWFPLRWFLPIPGWSSPATYARRWEVSIWLNGFFA